MRILITISLLFYLVCVKAQTSDIYRIAFSDSTLMAITNEAGIEKPKGYALVYKSDTWYHGTFYFKPKLPTQYPEGLNLYRYGSKVTRELISESQWSIFAHKALVLKSKKHKKAKSYISLKDSIYAAHDTIFLSATQPVFDKDIAIIDIAYYKPEINYTMRVQCFLGQALLIFRKSKNKNWTLIHINNGVLL